MIGVPWGLLGYISRRTTGVHITLAMTLLKTCKLFPASVNFVDQAQVPAGTPFQLQRVSLQLKKALKGAHGDYIPLSIYSPQVVFNHTDPSQWCKLNRIRFHVDKHSWFGNAWEMDDERSFTLSVGEDTKEDLKRLEEKLYAEIMQQPGFQDVKLKSCLTGEGIFKTKTRDTPLFTFSGKASSFEEFRDAPAPREVEAIVLITGFYLQHDTREVHLCSKIEHLRWGMIPTEATPMDFSIPWETEDEFHTMLIKLVELCAREVAKSDTIENDEMGTIMYDKLSVDLVERLLPFYHAINSQVWLQKASEETETEADHTHRTYQTQPQDPTEWSIMRTSFAKLALLTTLLKTVLIIYSVLLLDRLKQQAPEAKYLPIQQKMKEEHFEEYTTLLAKRKEEALEDVHDHLLFYVMHALMLCINDNASWRIADDLLTSPVHAILMPVFLSVDNIMSRNREFHRDGRCLLDSWLDRSVEKEKCRHNTDFILERKLWDKAFHYYKRSFKSWERCWKPHGRGLTHAEHRPGLVQVMKRSEHHLRNKKLKAGLTEKLKKFFKTVPEARTCYDSVKATIVTAHAPCPVCARTRCSPPCDPNTVVLH